jgi:hypothetical protein
VKQGGTDPKGLNLLLSIRRYRAPKKGKAAAQPDGDTHTSSGLADVVWQESQDDVAWVPPSGQTGLKPPPGSRTLRALQGVLC